MTETVTEVVRYFSLTALRVSCQHGQEPLSDAFAFDFKVCILRLCYRKFFILLVTRQYLD